MRKLLMVVAVVALAVPTASSAQFQLGLRLGYAQGLGKVDGSADMSDAIKSQIPLQVDALYKFSPEFAAGLYFSYGFGQKGDAIKSMCDFYGISCSVSDTRLGVEGIYSIGNASSQFMPWLGAGIGYEWFKFSASGGGATASATTTGFEFLNLQFGGDFKVGEKSAVGPFVMLSFGQYSAVEGHSLSDKKTHEWLNFGLRGRFDL